MRILTLSGFIPEQICDTVRFTYYEGGYKISGYCGYVSDYIAQVMEDPCIDGAAFPRSCDSSRALGAYLEDSRKFLYQMPVPARRDAGAVTCLASGIEHYQKAVEAHYGIVVTDVEDRIDRIQERNQAIRRMYDQLGESVVYSSYLQGIHKMLTKPLKDQHIGQYIEQHTGQYKSYAQDVRAGQTGSGQGRRVYLVGPFLANARITELIEQAGMRIIGDNLTESKRLFSAPPVLRAGNIYENIAKSILQNRPSPTQGQFSDIIAADLAEIKEKGAEGVIYISQKYCESYDYLYAAYKKALDEHKVPVLKVSVADSTDDGRLAFALEAFAELL